MIARELIKRKKFVYLCTNGILMKKKLDRSSRRPYFAWVVHLDGMRERHDQFVERDGTFDKAVDAIREAQAPRLPRQHEHDLPHDRHAEDGARRARLPERRAEGRPDDALARVRLREGARPGALPRRDAGAQALQRVVRGRQAQALAAEPHAALPRLPRGQGRLPVHAVGHPELLALRLAAAVLPDGRRLHARPTRS